MSASNSPVSALPNAADPSMEDILASIRRILSEDEVAAAAAKDAPPASAAPPPPPPAPEPEDDGVLVLDNSMMIGAPPLPEPMMPMMAPDQFGMHDAMDGPGLLAAESEAAAAASVGSLMRSLTLEQSTKTHRGGPTIEDLVRESIRPMLKNWLDVHLPPLVERVVRAEIERISGRAAL